MRSENSLEKSMMLGMGGGARKRGRPRARWLDDIKAITNCTLNELCGLTRDRDAWREMVMEITRSRPQLDRTRYKGGVRSYGWFMLIKGRPYIDALYCKKIFDCVVCKNYKIKRKTLTVNPEDPLK